MDSDGVKVQVGTEHVVSVEGTHPQLLSALIGEGVLDFHGALEFCHIGLGVRADDAFEAGSIYVGHLDQRWAASRGGGLSDRIDFGVGTLSRPVQNVEMMDWVHISHLMVFSVVKVVERNTNDKNGSWCKTFLFRNLEILAGEREIPECVFNCMLRVCERVI